MMDNYKWGISSLFMQKHLQNGWWGLKRSNGLDWKLKEKKESEVSVEWFCIEWEIVSNWLGRLDFFGNNP